ncbi:hypothetical protein C8F04DRAFT_316080 [Mycena alexandri]|uniref:SET domain-containing protein n=1 Tax=Mycena alexandri TaxID=1745969 RepID=A0AAD6T3H7_9AGAR|nr:hypothetical protein C8F04DRAFT_316080 [Mycena alexandri]
MRRSTFSAPWTACSLRTGPRPCSWPTVTRKEDGSGPLLGISRTDGLGIISLRPGVENNESCGRYTAVLKFISRLNHRYAWLSLYSSQRADIFALAAHQTPSLSSTNSRQLFAVRDIPAGEELTFRYVDVMSTAAQRNEKLKPYDFVCTCTA